MTSRCLSRPSVLFSLPFLFFSPLCCYLLVFLENNSLTFSFCSASPSKLGPRDPVFHISRSIIKEGPLTGEMSTFYLAIAAPRLLQMEQKLRHHVTVSSQFWTCPSNSILFSFSPSVNQIGGVLIYTEDF